MEYMTIHSGSGPVCKSGDTRIRSQGLCFQQTVPPPNFVARFHSRDEPCECIRIYGDPRCCQVVKVGSYSNKPYLGVKDLPSSKHSTSGWKMFLSMVLTVLQIVACSPTVQLCIFPPGTFSNPTAPASNPTTQE